MSISEAAGYVYARCFLSLETARCRESGRISRAGPQGESSGAVDHEGRSVVRALKDVNVTVILCTYNRCESLMEALASIALSRLPESVSWEVLVVDNNSRDQTGDVVADFCRRYPARFRYLLESRAGKSYALNRGIAEAQGDVLAFTDDDVTVEPTWLQKLTAPLLRGEWSGCGGRIFPAWSCTPPRWLPDGAGAPAPWPARCLRPSWP